MNIERKSFILWGVISFICGLLLVGIFVLFKIDQRLQHLELVSKSVQGDQQKEGEQVIAKKEEFNYNDPLMRTASDILGFSMLQRDSRGRLLLDLKSITAIFWQAGAIYESWNTRMSFPPKAEVTVDLFDSRLRLPYDPEWGSERFGVSPYEINEKNQVFFGPLNYSELYGAYRIGYLERREHRSLQEALRDERYLPSSGCAEESLPGPFIENIGSKQVLKYRWTACEGQGYIYEIEGKEKNYIFSVQATSKDELLQWVISHSELK